MFTAKPDIVHFGGGVHSPWASGTSSTRMLGASGTPCASFGTSFAAPIAASIAAQTWSAIEGHRGLTPSSALVKALVIHASQLSNAPYGPYERRYFGAGVPRSALHSLFDSEDSFTLVFDAQLVAGAYRWRKAPYPIPDVLMESGRFRGEVVITAVYSPPLDSDAGAEYVRSNVELSFGLLDGDRIKSKVPLAREPGVDTYEKAQIEHGGKWSPVKLHRATFPNGIAGGPWALQAQCSLRALEPPLAAPIQVSIVVTLRALDADTRVRADGVRALRAVNWVSQSLPIRVPVTV